MIAATKECGREKSDSGLQKEEEEEEKVNSEQKKKK